MFREAAVERYTFRCRHCSREWSRDYEAVHVTDEDGHVWEYYSLDGFPAAAPGAPGSVACPRCGTEHPETHFVASPVSRTRRQSPPPTPEDAPATTPVESARQLARTIEALSAAAKDPRSGEFSSVGDVKQVVQALQNCLVNLPHLLDDLGTALEHAERRPNARHAGDVPTAVRSLHRAAGDAHQSTRAMVDELGRARTALTTLESLPIHPIGERRERTA